MPDDSVIFEHFEVARRDDGTLFELGRGAMGVTYKAIDTRLGSVVALKVINPAYLHDDVGKQRFLREAKAAAHLNHPNVASIFHRGEHEGTFFYAMQFIEGETLEAFVLRRGPLPFALALRLILQAAQGLAAANARGLIHRDIKPANLMLDARNNPDESDDEADEFIVKVIDFGLVKSVLSAGGSPDSSLSGDGPVGTPYYMSPEQIDPLVGDVDARADIYSLGVTLWYLLTGKPPFVGTQYQVFRQHLATPPPLTQLPADVPRGVRALVARMMAKAPSDRPAGQRELIGEIKVVLRAPDAVAQDQPDADPPAGIVKTPGAVSPLVAVPPVTPGSTPGNPAERALQEAIPPKPKIPAGMPPIPKGMPPLPTLPLATPVITTLPVDRQSAGYANRGGTGQGGGVSRRGIWIIVLVAFIALATITGGSIYALVKWKQKWDEAKSLESGRDKKIAKDVSPPTSPATQTPVIEQQTKEPPARKITGREVKSGEGPTTQTLNVPGQFPTIQAAIDHARAGDTVLVSAGEYAESITFKNGVHLIGAGADSTSVVGEPKTNVLWVDGCQEGWISNMRFAHKTGDAGKAIFQVVMLKRSTVRLEHCRIDNASYCGIECSGGGKSVVSDCDVSHCGLGGVVVLNKGTEPTLRGNRFHDNKLSGIIYEAGGGGTADGNTCEGNGEYGITVTGTDTSPLISANECNGNTFAGINVSGVGAKPNLNGNHASHNKSGGIAFKKGAGGQADSNVCEDNTGVGIAVMDSGTSAVLTNNTANGNTISGIVFQDHSGGAAAGNTCNANTRSGLVVIDAGTSASLTKNHAAHNGSNGIIFTDGSAGFADQNVCEDNTESGIGVNGVGTRPTLTGNETRRNTLSGIIFQKEAGGVAENNLSENNKQSGILVMDSGTSARITGNRANGNRFSGVAFQNGTSGVAESNLCSGNTLAGIAVYGAGTAPKLRGNNCTGNKVGIYVEKGALPVISNNQFSGNTETQIYRQN